MSFEDGVSVVVARPEGGVEAGRDRTREFLVRIFRVDRLQVDHIGRTEVSPDAPVDGLFARAQVEGVGQGQVGEQLPQGEISSLLERVSSAGLGVYPHLIARAGVQKKGTRQVELGAGRAGQLTPEQGLRVHGTRRLQTEGAAPADFLEGRERRRSIPHRACLRDIGNKRGFRLSKKLVIRAFLGRACRRRQQTAGQAFPPAFPPGVGRPGYSGLYHVQ